LPSEAEQRAGGEVLGPGRASRGPGSFGVIFKPSLVKNLTEISHSSIDKHC
jgi:hypothetical protein